MTITDYVDSNITQLKDGTITTVSHPSFAPTWAQKYDNNLYEWGGYQTPAKMGTREEMEQDLQGAMIPLHLLK